MKNETSSYPNILEKDRQDHTILQRKPIYYDYI